MMKIKLRCLLALPLVFSAFISMLCMAGQDDVTDAPPDFVYLAKQMAASPCLTGNCFREISLNTMPALMLPTDKQDIFAVFSFPGDIISAQTHRNAIKQQLLYEESAHAEVLKQLSLHEPYRIFNILVSDSAITLQVDCVQFASCGSIYPTSHIEEYFSAHTQDCGDCQKNPGYRKDLGHARACLQAFTKAEATIYLLDATRETENLYETGLTSESKTPTPEKSKTEKEIMAIFPGNFWVRIQEDRQKLEKDLYKKQLITHAMNFKDKEKPCPFEQSQLDALSKLFTEIVLLHDQRTTGQIEELRRKLDHREKECKELSLIAENTREEYQTLQKKYQRLETRFEQSCAPVNGIPSDKVAVGLKLQRNPHGGMEATIENISFLQEKIDEIQQNIGELPQKMDKLELSNSDIRHNMEEIKLRQDVLDVKANEGTFVWKIPEIDRRFKEAKSKKTISLYSPPFHTSNHGYRMCIRTYLNGDGSGKSTHVSVFFVLMKSEYDNLLLWPFLQPVTFELVNQHNPEKSISETFMPDSGSASFKKPTSEMNVASGFPRFAPQSVLKDQGFTKDDAIYIRCKVDLENLEYVETGKLTTEVIKKHNQTPGGMVNSGQ